MSAIGGIYIANGALLDQETLSRMRDIVSYRGPDGSGIWKNGKVGFIHRLLWMSEESVGEQQPMTNHRGLWITADCRIDNRDDLKQEFQKRGLWEGLHTSTPCDAAYILLSYELWQEEAPNHLLGDFAFAIWDEKNQKLFCARDQIGIKSFVYHWDGKKFLFGSEMKQIFQDPSVSTEWNQAHLAEQLIHCHSNREETPYLAIQRLPAAHKLSIREGLFEMKRYWHWDPREEPLSKASLEENSEIFFKLFEDAVRVRLRVPDGLRAGSLLSGGLDSSSIVSVAASTQKNPAFPVFTLHFPEANAAAGAKNRKSVDESKYSQAVIQKYGLEPHRIEIKGWGPFENLTENLRVLERMPISPNFAYLHFLFMQAGQRNIRVMLHGDGGDELFLTLFPVWFRELKKGNGSLFFKEWSARRKLWGTSYRILFDSVLRNLFPEWIKMPYQRLTRKAVPDWIDPVFAKEIGLRDRAEKDFKWKTSLMASSSFGILTWLLRNRLALYLEFLSQSQAAAHLEVRCPFLDLRLLRFSATLPWDQKIRGGVSKFLLRNALHSYLPTEVRNRLGKTYYTSAIREVLQSYTLKEMREVSESPHPILQRMTVSDKVKSLYQNTFNGGSSHSSHQYPTSKQLWRLSSMDQWLKQATNFKPKTKGAPHEEQKECGINN